MSQSLTSPLTLQALLASGGAAPADPAVAAALPRLQMAQAMMQQGLSDAPTTKWGGLSRVGQALLGGFTFNKANEGLQNILQQRQANSVNALSSFFGGSGATPATGAGTTPTAPSAPPINTFAAQLAPAEGGANPGAVNDQGYSGQFQFGAGRLASTGQYTPAPGEDLKANQWKGTFSIPGFPDVKTHADFIASPAAQHAALGVDVSNTDKAIAATPGADKYDQNGLRAVAHLGGVDGMQKYIATEGKYNPADSNGTHLSDYYQRFSGAGAPSTAPQASTGQQAPQTAQSLDLMRKAMSYAAANPYDPMAQKNAAMMMDYAKTLSGLDAFKVDPRTGIQTNTRTGQEMPPAAPLPDYHPDPNNPGIMVSPGQKPVALPSPRIAQTPPGDTYAVGGGGVVSLVAPANNAGVAARTSAAAQGTETGKTAAVTSNKMFDLGRESDQAINNIDYGMNQLHQAAAGGIPSGYFAPWLATAAAAGKSLGVDTTALGIDPKAVGNVQSAQKTLGVVAGTILQNAIGKDSQITDAKIDHFIHTQPGIETDPEAIQRVLNWARSQFVYNREMAMDAMHSTDPNTGMLPPGWRAKFVSGKGAFAPIYDPLSGESVQPQGEGPAAAPPAPPPPVTTPSSMSGAQAAPTISREDAIAEARRRGLIK